MAKGASKSSASAATRKNHARKAAKDAPPTDTPPNLPKEKNAKGKGKSKGKESPRKKMYIPPVKPQPVQQDPIDTMGLAQPLPDELLVVWRGVSKKDAVTKGKALEELRAGWIERVHLLVSNSDDDAYRDADAEVHARLEALILSLPVWVRRIHQRCWDAQLKLLINLDSGRCTMCLRSSFILPAACVPWGSPLTQRFFVRKHCARRCSSSSVRSHLRSRLSPSLVAGAWPRAIKTGTLRPLLRAPGTHTSPLSQRMRTQPPTRVPSSGR